jgi:hypothetical protein
MMQPPDPPVGLRRVLTFWPLVLYGLSVIVGAVLAALLAAFLILAEAVLST